MKITDLLKMGLGNLWRRKLRTFLTILGVIVGSVSVVLMISIALGSEKATMEFTESIGNIRAIEVSGDRNRPDYYSETDEQGLKSGDNDNSPKLNEKAIEEISAMEHVEEVIPYYEDYFIVFSGKLESYLQVIAVDFEKIQKIGFELGRGRFPEKGEKAIIGYPRLANDFYDPNRSSGVYEESNVEVFDKMFNFSFNHPIDKNGNKKRLTRMSVVGETKDFTEFSWQAYMDIDLYKSIRKNDIKRYGNYQVFRRDKNKDNYSGFKVLVDNTDNVVAVTELLEGKNYSARNNMEMVENMKAQSDIMKYVLGGIGAVSLFVAAIGITNTMVMAIYERTREIGVMKVLGSDTSDILRLFLFEAAMIGFIGGVIGLGCSFLGSNLINGATQGSFLAGEAELSFIPPWLAIGSLIFSTLVGVVAGIVPAIRATHLSALEAIKSSNS